MPLVDSSAHMKSVPDAIVQQQVQYFGALKGIELGVGFNTLTSSVAGYCVNSEAFSCDDAAKRARYHKRYVSEAIALKRTLKLSASASFGTGIWSADAAVSFANSDELHGDSAYLYLDVDVALGDGNFHATLTSEASKKLRDDPVGFYTMCGDSYVATITKGARFQVVYEFKHLSEYSKQDLAMALSGSGANWNVDSSFQQGLEKSTERFENEIFVLQEGGKFEKSSMTIAELLNKANSFAAEVTCATPVIPTEAMTKSYYTASKFPDNARIINTSRQIEEIEQAAEEFDEATILSNDVADRIANPGRLRTVECKDDKRALEARREELQRYTASVRNKVSACRTLLQSGTLPSCTAAIAKPSFELPRLTRPEQCGPVCTDGVSSTYSSDEFGYCTRCTWKSRNEDGPREAIAPSFLVSECRFMRRGSKVLVRARGRIDSFLREDEGTAWIAFGLGATSGPESAVCDGPGQPDCAFWDGAMRGSRSFSFSNTVYISKRAEQSAIKEYLSQTMCQKAWARRDSSSPCQYRDVVFDICDVSSPNGCGDN